MITQNKSKSTNHHHKSIRFQIDLPSIEHHQQQQQQQQPVQLTPTIHLHINIDHSGQFSAKKQSQTTRNRLNHQLNSTTSGYSSGLSSSGSSHSLNSSASGDFLEYDDANNRGFCCDNQQVQQQASKNKQQTPQTVLANPNCYDKLSYVARGGANVVADESTLPTANVVVKEDVENIYEEISTFLESSKVVSATPIYVNQQVLATTEKPRCSGSNYENLRSFSSSSYSNYCRESNGNVKTPRVVMKPMTSSDDGVVKASSLQQQKKDILKREYTLNEIFENLKKFKKQAKEQEMLNVPVAAAVIKGSRVRVDLNNEHVYENQRVIRNATFV